MSSNSFDLMCRTHAVGSVKLYSILTGIMIATFLISLDVSIIATVSSLKLAPFIAILRVTKISSQGHSLDNDSIPCYNRHRLVWSYLSTHDVRSSTYQWQALFAAVIAMDIPLFLWHISSRISDMRCGKQFQNVHNRKSSCWCWRVWGSIGWSLSHCADNYSGAAPLVYWAGDISLCFGDCCRPNHRRRSS